MNSRIQALFHLNTSNNRNCEANNYGKAQQEPNTTISFLYPATPKFSLILENKVKKP